MYQEEEPACKLLRVSSTTAKDVSTKNDVQSIALDLTSAQSALSTIHLKEDLNLSDIKFVKVLKDDPNRKKIHVEGEYAGEKVVMLIEKTPFSVDSVEKIIQTTGKSLQKDSTNDIYGSYTAFPAPEYNGIKAVIIHPATDMHIQKYSEPKFHLILESFEDYQTKTLPFLESQQFSLDWVYNVLEHKKEKERIICEDDDKECGFVFAGKMGCDDPTANNYSALAIVHRRDIKCLRDLNVSHLPLLKNIKSKCLAAFSQKCNLKVSQIRSFIHYQPSYYHFHVHFSPLTDESAGVDRCHPLDIVIQNITLLSDYYQKVALNFVVDEKHGLYRVYNP